MLPISTPQARQPRTAQEKSNGPQGKPTNREARRNFPFSSPPKPLIAPDQSGNYARLAIRTCLAFGSPEDAAIGLIQYRFQNSLTPGRGTCRAAFAQISMDLSAKPKSRVDVATCGDVLKMGAS